MNVGEENKNELIEKNKKDDPRLEYNVNHHMNELMKEILAYYKEDGYDRFEEISMYIKKRLTKISFQYKLAKNEPKKLIEITDYEEKILVFLLFYLSEFFNYFFIKLKKKIFLNSKNNNILKLYLNIL